MPRPQYTKKDANHKAIVAKLEEWGYLVADVADLPVKNAFVDIYVWGKLASGMPFCLPVEIKPDGGRLSKSERDLLRRLEGKGLDGIYLVAHNALEVRYFFNHGYKKLIG